MFQRFIIYILCLTPLEPENKHVDVSINLSFLLISSSNRIKNTLALAADKHEIDGVRKEKERLTAAPIFSSNSSGSPEVHKSSPQGSIFTDGHFFLNHKLVSKEPVNLSQLMIEFQAGKNLFPVSR